MRGQSCCTAKQTTRDDALIGIPPPTTIKLSIAGEPTVSVYCLCVNLLVFVFNRGNRLLRGVTMATRNMSTNTNTGGAAPRSSMASSSGSAVKARQLVSFANTIDFIVCFLECSISMKSLLEPKSAIFTAGELLKYVLNRPSWACLCLDGAWRGPLRTQNEKAWVSLGWPGCVL